MTSGLYRNTMLVLEPPVSTPPPRHPGSVQASWQHQGSGCAHDTGFTLGIVYIIAGSHCVIQGTLQHLPAMALRGQGTI